MTNSKHLEKLKALVEVVKHLDDTTGMSGARINSFLPDPSSVSSDEFEAARAAAWEECMAVLLITKSDPKQCGALVADLKNRCTGGLEACLTTLSRAHDMLVNQRATSCPHSQCNSDHETGLAFFQQQEGGSGCGCRQG